MASRRHRRNYNIPGHAHELTFSCYRGFRFLQADRTCEWLADSLTQARSEWRFDLWAYVFMPDHAHLIIRPRDAEYDIAMIRKSIKSPVALKAIGHMETSAPEWLTRITRKRGTKVERLFWQSGGGYDRNVEDGRTLMKMIDYIHNNPVRAGLARQARDWRWSSAAWYHERGSIPIPVDPIPPEWLDGLRLFPMERIRVARIRPSRPPVQGGLTQPQRLGADEDVRPQPPIGPLSPQRLNYTSSGIGRPPSTTIGVGRPWGLVQ